MPVDPDSVAINEQTNSWGDYDFDHDGKPSRIVLFDQLATYTYFLEGCRNPPQKRSREASYRGVLVYEVELSGEEERNPKFRQVGVACPYLDFIHAEVGVQSVPRDLEDIFDPDDTGKVAFLFSGGFCEMCGGRVIVDSGRVLDTGDIYCT